MYPYNYCGRLFPWKLILSWFSSDKHIENLLASFYNSSLIPRFFIFQHFLIPPPPTPVQILIQPKWNGWQELGTQNISFRSVNYVIFFSFSPPLFFKSLLLFGMNVIHMWQFDLSKQNLAFPPWLACAVLRDDLNINAWCKLAVISLIGKGMSISPQHC